MFKKISSNYIFPFCIFVLFIWACPSCIVKNRITYLRDISDTSSQSNLKQYNYQEPVIQVDDILSVTIQTIDPVNSIVLNQLGSPIPSVGTSSAMAIGGQTITGYLVDKNGMIELPIIGKLKVSGISTFQARDIIKEKANQFFKNPTVQVRFANFRITILGEVSKPGAYTMPNEKVSILDAIGIAGDLTIFGKRDNVLLIRENNGVKTVTRFNLNSSELFMSPFFYLKQNDIIYVEPNKQKIMSTNAYQNRYITIAASALSIMILLIYRIN